jgi:hypothetical protein
VWLSRSRRKRPFAGLHDVSERDDKRLWHRLFRRTSRQLVRAGRDEEAPDRGRAVSNIWMMSKDGKRRFRPAAQPARMRK